MNALGIASSGEKLPTDYPRSGARTRAVMFLTEAPATNGNCKVQQLQKGQGLLCVQILPQGNEVMIALPQHFMNQHVACCSWGQTVE